MQPLRELKGVKGGKNGKVIFWSDFWKAVKWAKTLY